MSNYGPKKNNRTENPQGTKKKDELSLSGKAQQLQSVKGKIDYSLPIREEKVAELKQQVKQGTYNVRGEEVAKKMLDQVVSRKI